MEAHQERVVTEQAELLAKIRKLGEFFSGAVYPTLDAAEQARLARQFIHMQAYERVLHERIEAFAPTGA